MTVVFEDCKFLRATNIPSTGFITFEVTVNNNGKFEVFQGDSPVVTGKIKRISEVDDYKLDKKIDLENLTLNRKDIYKELRLRGYNYR